MEKELKRRNEFIEPCEGHSLQQQKQSLHRYNHVNLTCRGRGKQEIFEVTNSMVHAVAVLCLISERHIKCVDCLVQQMGWHWLYNTCVITKDWESNHLAAEKP